jgi:hypothetical protein
MIIIGLTILIILIFILIIYFKNKSITDNKRRCLLPKYNPSLWNNSIFQPKNNCYSYAINERDSNRKTKLYPGEKSGLDRVKQTQFEYTCTNFHERILSDIPNIFPSTYEDKCPCNYYKIALVLDNDENNKDFHFYREDIDGLWSHKPGSNKVTRKDASGNNIKNPFNANRDYTKDNQQGYNYNTKCNFYCIPYSEKTI